MTRKSAVKYLWPLGIAAVVVAAFVGLNGGGAAHATVSTAFQTLLAARNVPRNLVAFLCYQALTGPLLVYALLALGRRFAAVVAGLVAFGIVLSVLGGSSSLTLYAVPEALGLCFALACWRIVGDLDLRRALPLVVWLGSGLVALPYVQMSAKYLLPGVPAAALLIVLHAARVDQRPWPSWWPWAGSPARSS